MYDRSVLVECDAGSFDGVRLVHRRRVWVAAHDGLHCVDPGDGDVLGRLLLPEACSNPTFGGSRGNRLFITATTSLYSLVLNITGGARPTAPADREPQPGTGNPRMECHECSQST